jgi:hypothetical protein
MPISASLEITLVYLFGFIQRKRFMTVGLRLFSDQDKDLIVTINIPGNQAAKRQRKNKLYLYYK